jgi:sugar lactone lactonase YvrE
MIEIAPTSTLPRASHIPKRRIHLAGTEERVMDPVHQGRVRFSPVLAIVAVLASPVLALAASPEPALVPVWESANRSLHLSIDPTGRLWASTPDSTFDIYDRDGKLLETWGTFGRGDGQFDFQTPAGGKGGVTFRPDGGFYVSDSDNARIQEFDANRAFVRSWGSFGTGDDQFIGPDSLALDAAGNIYVNETGGDRAWIHVFDPTGTQVRVIREEAQGPFFAVDPDGTVYVIDEAASDLIRVGSDGSSEVVADMSGLIAFGTGVLHMLDGSFLVASERDAGVDATGQANLVHVGPSGEILNVWSGPNGGEYMALDPAGDRFYVSAPPPSSELRAYEFYPGM